jgi:hypothetical protein
VMFASFAVMCAFRLERQLVKLPFSVAQSSSMTSIERQTSFIKPHSLHFSQFCS